MNQEQALHAAIADRPHDTTPRAILADYYAEQGMPEHELAHRWLVGGATAGGVKPPQNHQQWREQTRGLDTGALAHILSHEADKTTGRAVVISHPVTPEPRYARVDHLARVSREALEAAGEGGRSTTARNRHSYANTLHETAASNHEAESHHGVQDGPVEHARKVKQEAAAAIHRQAQLHHYLAGNAHDWHDLDGWNNSTDYNGRMASEGG